MINTDTQQEKNIYLIQMTINRELKYPRPLRAAIAHTLHSAHAADFYTGFQNQHILGSKEREKEKKGSV